MHACVLNNMSRQGTFMVSSKLVKSLSCVWLFATPWTIAHQAPLSMGFSRQEITLFKKNSFVFYHFFLLQQDVCSTFLFSFFFWFLQLHNFMQNVTVN